MSAAIKILFIALLAIFELAGMAPNKMSTPNTFVVGLQCGYPPFEFMDGQGKLVGFDLDVSKRLAEKLKKKLIIKEMDFDGEILSLKQGKIDAIISGMNITPSRLEQILMIPYHGEAVSSLSLIFWNEIPPSIQSIEDITKLSNSVISVESGSIPDLYLNHYQGIDKKSFIGALEPLMDVKYGKSLANLVEPDVAEYLKRQHPEIKILNVPLPKEENILGFGIGVKKENFELSKQIETIIQELKASGELKLLEDKWFKGVEPAQLNHSYQVLLRGAFTTLQIALFSIAIGLIGGVLLGILNCNKMRNLFLTPFINGFVWIIRGTPLFIQVLILYYAIGLSLSPFTAGVLAIGINCMAYISEIVRGGINAIPEGQWEAAYIIGLRPVQTLKGIILPQMVCITLPSLTNELTALIKETSILMVIGVAELTKVSKDIVARELDPMRIYLIAAALYLAMTSFVSILPKMRKYL